MHHGESSQGSVNAARLPPWLSLDAVHSVADCVGAEVPQGLSVRVRSDGEVDAVAWSAPGPLPVTAVQDLVDGLGCDGRILRRALAMIPASRCQLGISVRWTGPVTTSVVVRFGALQTRFEPVQGMRRVQALATLASVALGPELTVPGRVQAVSLELKNTCAAVLVVERTVPVDEVPKASGLWEAAIERRHLMPADGPLVAWRDDGGSMSRSVASEWRRVVADKEQGDGCIGVELDEAGALVARWVRATV